MINRNQFPMKTLIICQLSTSLYIKVQVFLFLAVSRCVYSYHTKDPKVNRRERIRPWSEKKERIWVRVGKVRKILPFVLLMLFVHSRSFFDSAKLINELVTYLSPRINGILVWYQWSSKQIVCHYFLFLFFFLLYFVLGGWSLAGDQSKVLKTLGRENPYD